MGWTSWNTFFSYNNEDKMISQADALLALDLDKVPLTSQSSLESILIISIIFLPMGNSHAAPSLGGLHHPDNRRQLATP